MSDIVSRVRPWKAWSNATTPWRPGRRSQVDVWLGPFLKAVDFEISWLENKKNHYGSIHREDDLRLDMMRDRYQRAIVAIRARGG